MRYGYDCEVGAPGAPVDKIWKRDLGSLISALRGDSFAPSFAMTCLYEGQAVLCPSSMLRSTAVGNTVRGKQSGLGCSFS